MPRSDDFGTYNMGRWAHQSRISNTWSWESVEDDPYHGLRADGEAASWDEETNARAHVQQACEEHGIDHEFMFGVESMTFEAMNERVASLEQCQRDPAFAATYLRENMFSEAYWEGLITGVRAEFNKAHFLCINPTCHRTLFPEESDEYRAIGQCNHCGGMTMVRDDLLLGAGPVDGTLHGLLTSSLPGLMRRASINNIMLGLGGAHDCARVQYRSQRPHLYISTDIPQLKVDGDHFIRGRVNREVMSEYGFDSDLSFMMLAFSRSHPEMVSILSRLLGDEDIMLDEGRADKFRQEFVDTQWEDEFIDFVSKLRASGTLKVDSAGVQDTLTALYNMAQKKSGKKTIIKRNGKIVFPTQHVLENISQPLIERAFNVTEHGRYEDLSVVFEAGEGVQG